jgi:hypothetical protein
MTDDQMEAVLRRVARQHHSGDYWTLSDEKLATFAAILRGAFIVAGANEGDLARFVAGMGCSGSHIQAAAPSATATHSFGRCGIAIFLIPIASRTLFSMA